MSAPKLIHGYEVVIGFETHTQLLTRSKIFSRASTAFGAEPNTQAAPVDLALPGTLPVMNREAVACAIRFGLAVGATVAQRSIFARKNYFYPDLPKGYQISQYEIPVVQGGAIEFFVGGEKKRIHLTRAHLEEDAGKSVHGAQPGMSGIDLNRAGTPLLEIVSEPELRSSDEAVEYARALHTLVVWLGICDGNMQEGSFRCDANVSVRKPGEPFGTRREIKNLNSFRFLKQAIDYEVRWQIEQLEDGHAIEQATVLFNPDTGETRAMRTKEDAHDYRYFPDPDLPPLVIAPAWIEQVRGSMPPLPSELVARYQSKVAYRSQLRSDLEAAYNQIVYGLTEYEATAMVSSRAMAEFFEAVTHLSGQPRLAANWLMGEVSKRLNGEGKTIEQSPVRADQLAALLVRVADGTLSANGARQLLDMLWVGDDTLMAGSWEELNQMTLAWIETKGLRQMSDSGELEKIIDEVLAANQKSVDEFKAGKDKAFQALVGQAMRATKGKANPALVNELLRKKLA